MHSKHKSQRWSRGHKARSQGQGHKKISRPRRNPLEAKAKDKGHRRKCSPKKRRSSKKFSSNLKNKVFKIFFQAKKVFKNFFSGDFHLRKTKKGLSKFSARFLALSNKISTVQKILLSSSRGQGNFRGLKTSRPRTSKSVLEDSTSDNSVIKGVHFCLKCITPTVEYHSPSSITLNNRNMKFTMVLRLGLLLFKLDRVCFPKNFVRKDLSI